MTQQPPENSRPVPSLSNGFGFKSLFPTRPLHFIGAAVVFGVIGAVGALGVSMSGFLDLSASAPHPEAWARLLHSTFQNSVAEHAETVPSDISLDDPALIMAGAGHYANVCATCHGAPGFGQNPIALSLRPEPPMIVNAAKHYTPGELFHIVEGGVRYSAMPAWPVSNRADEVWAVVAFLMAMPDMDRAEYEELAFGKATNTTATPSASQVATATDQASSQNNHTATPGKAPRPYLPGDPQSLIASAEATDRPSTGFVQVRPMQTTSAACSSCHGVDGAGRDGGAFPNLTLHSPEYLAATLNAFASGDRQSGIMWPVAANLSESEINQLANEFGGRAALPSRGADYASTADPELLARGKEIALNGIPLSANAQPSNPGEPVPTAVQACQGCHGAVGEKERAMPQIAGQNAAYIANQLRLFRHHGRGNSLPYNPMSTVSHKLHDADIEALAAYYQSLPPAKQTAGG